MNSSVFILAICVFMAVKCDPNYEIINNEINDEQQHDDTASSASLARDDPCYDKLTGIAQRCIPSFENLAYGKKVIASSTCGGATDPQSAQQQPTMDYCVQSSNLNRNYRSFRSSNNGPDGVSSSTSNSGQNCDKCDSSNPDSVRGAKYLTDLEETNSTCWISAPVYDPTETSNLTLHISFAKKYELTYISLQFCTSLKPDSLSIMKSMDYGKTWIPFQFYSSECKKVFNRPLKAKITQANEQEAVCTDQHLQSSPFNTNRIGFSTLEGRPSFHEFDTSPVLQDWVTATDIKVVFNRLLSPVLYNKYNNYYKKHATAASTSLNAGIQSSSLSRRHSRSKFYTQMQNFGYYYAAVSELAIGGRCKCNGHASRCVLNKYANLVYFRDTN